MIESAWAGIQSCGLRRLVLASANASKELSMESMRLWIKVLSAEHQQATYEGEENGDHDSSAYKAAIGAYMMTFLC